MLLPRLVFYVFFESAASFLLSTKISLPYNILYKATLGRKLSFGRPGGNVLQNISVFGNVENFVWGYFHVFRENLVT